jgi:hypothetical protein
MHLESVIRLTPRDFVGVLLQAFIQPNNEQLEVMSV